MQVLLIGNPNAGKSSLFEVLTGSVVKIANHSGVTVQAQHSCCCFPGEKKLEFVDLPGIYSLMAYSEEERITLVKLEHAQAALVFVLDAVHLKRNLFLLTQMLEVGYQPLVALTQIDLAREMGLQIDDKLLEKKIQCRVITVSAKTQEGLLELKQALCQLSENSKEKKQDFIHMKEAERYRYIDQLLEGVLFKNETKSVFDPDRFLLHPIGGIFALFGIFSLLFLTLFVLGKPIANLLESNFDYLGQILAPALLSYPMLSSLLIEGVLAGVGTLLAFVPLIALLFFLLGLLEESGYLARATFLLDRILSKAGLSGRAFAPLLSGFACAIPAILSTRVIRSRQNRLITMLVLPFLSCSARLPLYALLVGAFFPAWQGALVLLGLYALGILAAFLGGYALKRFWFKAQTEELILEMPRYQVPRIRPILKTVGERTANFLKQAGTLILSMSILMWALFHFPRGVSIEYSLAGQIGHLLEPLITPLGFDWKIALGLLASFSAREVMVSTLGIIYGMDSDWALQYTPLVAISLLVFFALAMQCGSTLVIMRRETNTWKWPLFQLGAMTGIAWISSFIIFQVGSFLGY